MFNPNIEIDIAYVREDKPFEDELLNLKPIYSEKLVEKLGCNIVNIKDVSIEVYDYIIDIMYYKVYGDFKNGILGLGTIQTYLANKFSSIIYIDDYGLIVDDDVFKFIVKRIEFIKKSSIPENVVKIKFTKHVNSNKVEYIGFGSITNFENYNFIVQDPLYVHKQCILKAIEISFKLKFNNIPYWFSLNFGKLKGLTYGFTSKTLLNLGKMVTSIPYTFEDIFVKVLTFYGRGVMGFQVYGISNVDEYVSIMYSVAVSELKDYLPKLIFYPRVFDGNLRTWIDNLIETFLKEMYWLYYERKK